MSENSELITELLYVDVNDINNGIDYQYFDKPQILSHVTKTRPRRKNVTKPRNKNPQASVNDLAISEDLEKNKIQPSQLDIKKSIDNIIAARTYVPEQPKISLENLDGIKLRSNLKNRNFNKKNNDETTSRSTMNYSKNKFRDRMSIYEGSTYLAEPNNPTNYLEIFNLENPKFDQEAIKNSHKLAQKDFKRQSTLNSMQKILESQQTNPLNSIDNTKNTRPRSAKSPSALNPERKIELPTQMNINSILKPYKNASPMEQQKEKLDIKLRNKKPLENLNEPIKMNKFSNRFSMFEPTCQKSCNTLKLNRLKADTNNEYPLFLYGDQELPKSIKDRIKLFSK